jgi:sec-independent protein translocase protein TatA
MYGISGEHLLILLVILLIFGPRRLPDLGHSIGRTMKNFKDGISGNSAEPKPTPVSQQIEAKSQGAAEPAQENAPEKEPIKETEKV